VGEVSAEVPAGFVAGELFVSFGVVLSVRTETGVMLADWAYFGALTYP
jgi:hypothetical protein